MERTTVPFSLMKSCLGTSRMSANKQIVDADLEVEPELDLEFNPAPTTAEMKAEVDKKIAAKEKV